MGGLKGCDMGLQFLSISMNSPYYPFNLNKS